MISGLYGLNGFKELGGLDGGLLGHILATDEIAQGCAATALTFNLHSALGNLFVASEREID